MNLKATWCAGLYGGVIFSLCLLAAFACGDKSTSNKPPEAPSNLSGQALSSSSLLLFWADNSDNETDFVIYRKSDAGWSSAGTANANRISFTDTMLADSTTYAYRLTARNDAGESAPSDTVAISTLSLGLPPQIPSNPSPADDSTGVPIQARLCWACSDPDGDSLEYDIYFGTGSYLEPLDSNLNQNYFDLYNLIYDTPYNWKIVARDNHHHLTSGPIWHFRTKPNSAPFTPLGPVPADDSTGVDINMNLGWQCQDPEGDSLWYDVFFGANANLTLIGAGIPQASFDPGRLLYGTSYSWRITARDSFNNETRGPLWSFVTRDSSYFLTVLLQGMGNVNILPDRQTYAYGDSVTLTAVPDSNWIFAGWSGDISETSNPLTIIITRNLSITAVFTERSQSSATISGTITWPGHALTSHTYFFADTLSSQLNIYEVGRTSVDPATGNFTLVLDNLPGPLPLLFEGQDDVNNSGAHEPLDAGDGWGYYDRDGDGRWLESDTIFVAPGAHIPGIDIELHLISADKPNFGNRLK
jgi:hypothetical protein